MDVKGLAAEVQEYLIGMRREFHRHPEPSMKEFETNKRIKEELDKMGVPWESVGDTLGIMGTLKGGKPGKTLMLRSDMDALEIQEESGVDFASEKPAHVPGDADARANAHHLALPWSGRLRREGGTDGDAHRRREWALRRVAGSGRRGRIKP